MKRLQTLIIVCITLIIPSLIWGNPTAYEYSDAPGYQTAWHSTGQWQRLGSLYDEEIAPLPNDASDDGVRWSVDGGTTWGHDTLTIGQSVTFEFNMYRSNTGTHPYDQLKAWVDWNGDKDWDDAGELIIGEKWIKDNNSNILNKVFTKTLVVPDYTTLGETWLRARVSCHHTSFEDSTPYGHMWQGEVEDYAINTSAVPVPSTLALVGLGMAGIRRFKRRLIG